MDGHREGGKGGVEGDHQGTPLLWWREHHWGETYHSRGVPWWSPSPTHLSKSGI